MPLIYRPKDFDTHNLLFLLSLIYLSLLEFEDHRSCLPINLSLTSLLAAAEAPPDLKYKKQRNLCVNLRKKAIKQHIRKVTDSGITEDKKHWKVIKPFITNKNGLSNNNITLIHNNSVITDDKELTSLFNDHYINVVEKTTGVKPFCISYGNFKNKNEFICDIISRYKNHPSIVKVKEMILHNEAFSQLFNFKEISQTDVQMLFKELDTNTSTGEDKIPPKLVKLASKCLIPRL